MKTTDEQRAELMTAEELEAARYAVSSGDSAEADFTTDWGAKVFGHIDAQAATVDELRERVRALEAEREEDQGVIRVWRGRTERAEAERDRARNDALEAAQEALGAEFRNILNAFPEPCERRSGVLDMHAAGAAAISALRGDR